MSDDMLGVALRAARGPLVTLIERLSGQDGEQWLIWLNKFNRRQNPWTDNDVRARTSVDTDGVVLPGRGGAYHKSIQSLIKRIAADRGFRVKLENRVLEGRGHVDVALEYEGRTFAFEISVSTSVEHEVGNMVKCLASNFDYVVLVCPDADKLDAVRAEMGHADDARFRRMRFLDPDSLLDFFNEVAPRRLTSSRSNGEDAGGDATTVGLHSTVGGRRGMLIAEDAATYLGLGQQSLAKMRLTGDSPPYHKVGRRVLYDPVDLDVWLAERKRKHTSDPGPILPQVQRSAVAVKD